MERFNGIFEAHTAAQDYFFKHREDFDAAAQERLRAGFALGASPVDALVAFAEIVFANPDKVPKAANKIAAGIADFATTQGWHGLAEGGDTSRGRTLVKSLRRRGGDKSKPGDDLGTKDDDPTPLAQFDVTPPPEPEAIPAPPTDTAPVEGAAATGEGQAPS